MKRIRWNALGVRGCFLGLGLLLGTGAIGQTAEGPAPNAAAPQVSPAAPSALPAEELSVGPQVSKAPLAEAAKAVEPYEGDLATGLASMQTLAKESKVLEAEQLAERLLAETPRERAQTWLENRLLILGPRSVRLANGLLSAVGWTGRTNEERAVVRYDLGVLQAEAGALDTARGSFQASTYLAGGAPRERSTYNLGWLDLSEAEALFDQIPEVHGRTQSAMSPGFVPSQAKNGEEEPDYLKAARAKYESSLAHFVERLKLDWRDADTRANVEWIQKRLDELRAIEAKRKSDEGQGMAQDDPSANQGEQEENKDDAGDQGANSEEQPEDPESSSETNTPRENEQGEASQPKDSADQNQDGQQRDQASQEEQTSKETPEEHILTEEEMKRLLKRMEEYSKEGERLRGMMKPRPQGRVKKDW